MKVTPGQANILRQMASGHALCKLPHMGRFQPNDYYYFHDTAGRVNASSVKGLLTKKLVEQLPAKMGANHVDYKLTEEGKKVASELA